MAHELRSHKKNLEQKEVTSNSGDFCFCANYGPPIPNPKGLCSDFLARNSSCRCLSPVDPDIFWCSGEVTGACYDDMFLLGDVFSYFFNITRNFK